MTEKDPLITEKVTTEEKAPSAMGAILKRILIIVGVLVLIFGGIVGFFVVKARRAQAGQAE